MTHHMEMQPYEKLKKLREQSNLTQDYVAKKLGISRQTISKWETGKSSPDIGTTLRLCDLYGISIDELLNTNSKDKIPKNNSNTRTTSAEDTPSSSVNNSNSWGLNKKQLTSLEIIGLAVILVLACQFSIIGAIVPITIIIWLHKTKRNYKFIYFLCFVCLLINIYNTYILIDHFIYDLGTYSIEKL